MVEIIIRPILKPFKDILSTLYDEDKYMSLPRLFCFVSFCLFIIAWFLEQCLGMPFEHFAELTGFFGIAMGSYVGKKFSEKGKRNE